MASAADISREEPSLAGVAWAMRGWHNPLPISIRLQPSDVVAVREDIRRNLAVLIPRCELMERSLPERMLCHFGYVSSKLHRDFSLEFEPDRVGGPVQTTCSEPMPRLRHAAVPEASAAFAESLVRDPLMLAVGAVVDPHLNRLLAERQATCVTSGDGEARIAPSGRKRPAADSFSTWLAEHDESERAALGAIVFGRSAGRVDVDMLRCRLYDHHWVLVEAGSAALTWMLAQWDGNVTRHGNVFAFSEPGEVFHEPSARTRISSAASWPRLSVVTISYNQHNYLEQCIDSVLSQGYPNLEFIVVDAQSTDGSIDILRRYEKHFTHLLIEPDEGQSCGLNKGFNLATGEILTWVNSDDMLAPLALKRAAIAFAKSGASLVAGTCSRVAGSDAKLLYRHYAALPTEQPVSFYLGGPLDWCGAWEKGDYFFQPEVFFTRDIWERAGGFLKPHLYWAMDWDLWLRCALAGASVVRIPDVLGVSRVHDAQKTTSDERYLWQVTNILREYDDLLASLERALVIA